MKSCTLFFVDIHSKSSIHTLEARKNMKEAKLSKGKANEGDVIHNFYWNKSLYENI